MGQPEPPISRTRAVLALVMTNAMWGASFPLVKALNLKVDAHFGVSELDASTQLQATQSAWMIAVRFSIAFGLFLIFLPKISQRANRQEHGAGALLGLFFFCGMLLQVVGLASIPASRSGFLTSLAVVITPVVSTLLGRALPRASVLAAVAFALVGVAVLTGMVTTDGWSVVVAADALDRWTLGDTSTVMATFFFSAHILLLDRLGRRCNPIAMTPAMFATAAVAGWCCFFASRGFVPELSVIDSPSWAPIAISTDFVILIGVLCVFPSLIAFALMNRYQTSLSAAQAAVIYTLEPLFASLFAMFLPGMITAMGVIVYANETFSTPHIAGGLLILVANVLALWPARRRKKLESPTPIARTSDVSS